MTRRILLTVCGLTLLSAYAPEILNPLAGRAPHRRPPGPAARHPSTRARLTRADRFSAGRRGRDLPMARIPAGPNGSKAIAPTIDDGPDPVYTPQVLRLLDKYRVTATFSMIGIQVHAHPGVAREVAAAGHLIANHTWSHLDLAWLPLPAVTDQISRRRSQTGSPPPPGRRLPVPHPVAPKRAQVQEVQMHL